MKIKKTISLILIFAIILSLVQVPFVYATDAVVKYTVTADKTSIQASSTEQTINYTISMSNISVKEPLAISFFVDIPEGLTLNEDSISVTPLKDINGDQPFENAFELNPAQNKYQYTYLSLYEADLENNQVLVKFSCTTDRNLKSGKYEVTLSDITVAGFDADESYKSVVDAGYFNIVPATTNVVVPVTGVSLNTSALSLTSGSTGNLKATVLPTGATNATVTYTSDNEKVATVSDAGVVTAKSVGTATITVKTADGDYTDTCTVTVTCAHKNTTTHEAVKSTCAIAGHEAYVQCDDCGKIISGSNKPLPLAEHTYGNLIEQLDPTHTSTELLAGTKAHYQCSVCGKLFDENKNEVTEEDLIIEAPTHTYGDYVSNEESHWKECGCGNIIERGEHTGGTATCVKRAVCSICGAEYGEVDSSNHINRVVRDVVEATCTEEGYTGDTYCADCDVLIAKGTVAEPLGHTGGTATCVSKAVCERCGEEYGEIDSNNHANTVVKDKIEATCTEEGYTGDTYCEDCDVLIAKGTVAEALGHTGGIATCIAKPICERCGEEYGEIDANNHIHTVVKDAVEATTTSEGYTGDTYCEDCDKLVSKGEVIPVITEENKEEQTQDTTKQNGSTQTSTTSTTPDTSDTSKMAIWVSLLVASGISFGVIAKCRVKESQKAKRMKK